MPSRKTKFSTNEFYHCFNRGVDKRIIFQDSEDYHYFLTALRLFNQTESLGDMRHYKQNSDPESVKQEPLVSIIAYCLNPNHFHLLLHQEAEDGITQFMRKLGTGYTMYFNKKNQRSGSLFQGQFKSVHTKSDTQLQHLFAYVTNNNIIHKITDPNKFRNSFTETTDRTSQNICNLELLDKMFVGDLKSIINKGIKHTITYRNSLEQPDKSELLE